MGVGGQVPTGRNHSWCPSIPDKISLLFSVSKSLSLVIFYIMHQLLFRLGCNVFFFFFNLAAPGLSCRTPVFCCGMRDLQLWHANFQLRHVESSSLTRDGTWAACIGSAESQPLDHQGSPGCKFLFASNFKQKNCKNTN